MLVGYGVAEAKNFAVVSSLMFGSATTGGGIGGVLFHTIRGRRRFRTVVGWSAAGLTTGLTMAISTILFRHFDGYVNWYSLLFILGGLTVGTILGINFSRPAKQ